MFRATAVVAGAGYLNEDPNERRHGGARIRDQDLHDPSGIDPTRADLDVVLDYDATATTDEGSNQ